MHADRIISKCILISKFKVG